MDSIWGMGKKGVKDDRWSQGRLQLESILQKDHGFILSRSSLRCLLDFHLER